MFSCPTRTFWLSVEETSSVVALSWLDSPSAPSFRAVEQEGTGKAGTEGKEMEGTPYDDSAGTPQEREDFTSSFRAPEHDGALSERTSHEREDFTPSADSFSSFLAPEHVGALSDGTPHKRDAF